MAEEKNEKRTSRYKKKKFKLFSGSKAKSKAKSKRVTVPELSEKAVIKRKPNKPAKIILIASLLIAVAFIAVITLGDFSISNGYKDIKGFFANFDRGEGYPYQTGSADIVSVDAIGSDIIILNKDSIKILNSTAKEIFSVQHTYSDAVMDVCNGRAIVYDRASGRFKVVSRSGVLFEKDLKQSIFVASIGRTGVVAVGSKSDGGFQSELRVFDRRGNETNDNGDPEWQCAEERISALAFSDNGKSIAAAVIGAKDGEIYSKLHVLNLAEDSDLQNPPYYSGTALIKLKFGGKDTLLAIGDNLLSAFNVKTLENNIFDYEAGVLNRLSVSDKGKIALVLSSFGNTAQNELKVFDTKGSGIYEKSFDQEIKWVSCDENYTSVLLSTEAQSFNNAGKLMGSIKAEDNAEKVIIIGKKAYLCNHYSLNRYSSVGSNQ